MIENKQYERAWVASVIANGTPSWIASCQRIHKRDLTQEGQYWLSFVYFRIMPAKNETDIIIEKEILNAFPCLFHALSKATTISPFPKHDHLENAIQHIDIT